MSKKKILIIVGAVLVLVILLASIFGGGSKEIKVAVEKVSRRTITEIVAVSGKIQPESEVKISADVSGEIIDMFVKEGDSVKAGQLLLRINPELYETTMDQLAAAVDNAKASLASAEAQRASTSATLLQQESNFRRQKKLFDEKVISAQEFETAKTQFDIAKANLESADKNIMAARFTVASTAARLEEGRRNLGRTSIYAPSSGIVTQLNSEKGERVVGTAQMAGTEIMRISNLNVMEVQVDVNENDIVRLKIGDSADIEVDAYEGRIFAGIVTEISNSAKFNAAQILSDQVTNFVVKVRVLPESYKDLGTGRNTPFRPGMTASVKIKTKRSTNCLSVPIAAVTTRNPMLNKGSEKEGKSVAQKESEKNNQEGTWVFKLENGKAIAVKVKTGVQDIDYFEVIEGLKEGEEIIIAPGMTIAKTLYNGDAVKKVDKDKVYEKN